MAKIVFFCIPAHGHTNPTLGVVEELTQRGHSVWYYSYEPMRQKIEAAGATFVPCESYDAEQKLTPAETKKIGADLALSTRVLVDTTLALDDTVCRHMARLQPDCIVADSMAVWGKAIAIKLGIPFISSTTTFAFNRHSAKIMKQSPKQMLSMLVSMPEIRRHIRRLQNKGYPIKSVLDILQNDDQTHTIVYTSPDFQPCSETFSDKYVFVGPSIRPATQEIKKDGRPLVYISMGSVNYDMLSLYQNCISAFSDGVYQVILSAGERAKDFTDLPENISVLSWADQIAVLQKSDVFLSHCGMNSVNESLYFGVPLVMLPQTPEQGGVASRTQQLGAGVLLKKTDPKSIRSAVEQVLLNTAYRESAERISASFHLCGGANAAADKILSLCGQ